MLFIKQLKRLAGIVFVGLLAVLLLAKSTLLPGDQYERIRAFTRMIEFDYVNWTVDALLVKNVQEMVKAPSYMSAQEQRNIVFEYFRIVRWVNQTQFVVDRIYSDPDIHNPGEAAADQSNQLRVLKEMEQSLKPLAEAVLQHQVSATVTDMGLGFGGQPIPPVLYHATRLPDALIISPRNAIRQDADISLQPELSTEEITRLENEVEKNANVSALVVPIGGVGTYPTMVMDTTNLEWLLETVSHEWTHNFLTLRPLGALYMASSELRTINETTANLSGKEIGLEVMRRYYPEMLPPEERKEENQQVTPTPTPTPNPNEFNFNREMHNTRVQVDALLAKGKVKEAEDYMEERRRFFWNHGYQIRKLNQAYFAFYGAYNDVPGGGAAGRDPVGPAVQELRRRSSSLANFLNRISWITSFSQLQQMTR